MKQTLVGHWAFADRHEHPYRYIPFEMPAGVGTLAVAYRTSLRSARGTEHVDIGLFDPRGHELHEAVGFRGWSGSARAEFLIGPEAATPGYVAGPLYPGTWHIVLGSESRKAEDVHYEIELDFRATVVPGAARLRAPFSDGTLRSQPGYYRGDLHCHTVHSDGTHSLEVVAGRAAERGLEFLSITNHNVVATAAPVPDGFVDQFLLLGGQEVTTYRGHLNVWGIRDWIEFRACTDDDMRAIVEAAHARGGVTSINHPRTGGPAWEFAPLPAIPCLEVWNGPWVLNNHEALATYDRLLCDGRRLTAVGGSDIHVVSTPDAPYPYELGTPTTQVYASALSERALLEGLRTGRVCITAEPQAQWVELRVAAEGTTAVMGDTLAAGGDWDVTVETVGFPDAVVSLVADGREVACVPAERAQRIPIPAPQRYVRAEVLREPAAAPQDRFALALTNPVYRGHPG